ncbi:MAG: N-6 DNA methylase [Candidatus Methanomethylicaceae archaeon]
MKTTTREATFQDKLIDLIQNVSSKYRFDGLEISKVERDYPIDTREVDITVFIKGDLPFLLIETKRKIKEKQKEGLFDPLGTAALGQAISYAVLYEEKGFKVPFFATSNPKSIAVFRTPEKLQEYINYDAIEKRNYRYVIKHEKYADLLKNYLIIREELKLNEEYIQNLLDRLAKDYLKKKILKIELNYALIEQFRLFVEDVSGACKDLLKLRMREDPILKNEIEKLKKEAGYEPTPENLIKMMTYVLMNKLIFYKIIEEKYKLPRMIEIDTSSSINFIKKLNEYFEKAIEITGNFEPIFKTGIYDLIPIPDDPSIMDRINDFISFLDSIKVEEIGELAGYIYEELIPPEERHRLGQFYTPPAICELITKWAIRNLDNIVLDPGVGSGGFLLQAYRILLKLKTGKDTLPTSKEIHERILKQLYAIDINPFPAHLTAMNLSMRNVRVPSTTMNVIVGDFFTINPKQEVEAPYVIKTVAGEIRRKFLIPEVDVVIGNPPYTRWTEIPEKTKNMIKESLGKSIKEYSLTPQISRGIEPGIYVYWVMHANRFLKEKGRLGMIISNLWMQTDYGIKFGKFLLNNFKIKAIIDFTLRLFTALISTCVILMEKENNKEIREENEIVFIHIPGQIENIKVDEILEIIKNKTSENYYVKVIKQKDIPEDKKWIDVFLGKETIFEKPLFIKLNQFFEPFRGNTVWSIYAISHGKRPDVGASEFHYLSPSKLKENKLMEYAYPNVNLKEALIWPAITSARQIEFFTFNEEDWKKMLKNDEKCYMFIGHKPRDELPKEVNEYVKWGETECRTKIRKTRGGGRLANETESAKIRAKTKGFCGWYDLGGVEHAPIFAVRQARYKTRFIKCDFPVAMYDALIAFIPKIELSNEQINALLAYLNSSFTQYYIETHGRYIAKGPIGLEVSIAKDMPILDIRKLSESQIKELAKKFNELENETRKIGGASEKEEIEKIKPKIYEIDKLIGEILDLKLEEIKDIEKTTELLIERRISGAKEPRPELIEGERKPKISPSKRKIKKEKEEIEIPLDKFLIKNKN